VFFIKETCMFKRRTLASALAAATLLVATSSFAQFADRTIKFTNGVNEDHPVGVGVKKMQEVLAAASTSCIFFTPTPTGWSSFTPFVNLMVRSANWAKLDVATSKVAAARAEARVLRLNIQVSFIKNTRGEP